MENKTLTHFFRNMTLAEAWEGNFDSLIQAGMPTKQAGLLWDICQSIPESPAAMYEFLVEKDPLFRSIYGIGQFHDGKEIFVFPFIVGKTIPEGIQEVRGPIGTQTSKYHHETIQQHIGLVTVNLVDAGVPKELAVMLAVLHDIGKKYTSATNKVGGICAYNHGEISAFITGHWLRRTFDERKAKEIVAVIYGHMLPLNSWNVTTHWRTGEPVDFRRDFYEGELLSYCDNDTAFADRIMSLIDTFSECDEGVSEFTPIILEKIARGQKLICE
ncbi:hypothetical protein IJG22_02310 [Candidatus Saccharibacteria bacterium]|nr:hypothetical protein [Candidatus Saccharibacteria bacterium]